jgi:sulfatase modifying factor 1
MRAARLLSAFVLSAAFGCTIYNSTLLLPADDGGTKGNDGKSPPHDAGAEGGPECKSGTTECTGGKVQSCVDGAWVVEQVCPAGCGADGGGCIESPSCKGGGPGADQTCGWTSNANCCATLPVPGGTYLRSGVDGGQATVSDFSLDQFEATVGRYRKFVNAGLGTQLNPPKAGAGANPHISGSGWNDSFTTSLPSSTDSLETSFTCSLYPTWTDSIEDTDDLPMNCLTWFEAFAFCAWDGGRLPTEAEWNYAAAAGKENRYYPWSQPPTSQAIDPSYAVYDCTAHNGGPPQFSDAGDGATFLDCVMSDILPVGSRPKGNGKWGHVDMAGSMGEWVLDWFHNPFPLPCDDCAELDAGMPEGGPVRLTRGGGYYYQESLLTTWSRYADFPNNRDDSYGVRCAHD